MKNLLTLGMLALLPLLYGFSVSGTDTTLADEIVGTYTGKFAKDGQTYQAFKVKVTKVSDDEIEVLPIGGNGGQPFKAKIEEDNLSAIRIIRLKPMEGVVLKNGMITPANGRLSYGVSSKKGLKLEVFSGIRH